MSKSEAKMNLDYELLQNILQHIRDVGDGQERHTVTRHTYANSPIQTASLSDSFDVFAYHFDILVDNNFVSGQVVRVPLGGHSVVSSISFFNLTLQGHQLLESMENNTIWDQIKIRARQLGVEGLRQVPGLAISLIKGTFSQ